MKEELKADCGRFADWPTKELADIAEIPDDYPGVKQIAAALRSKESGR